MRTFLPIINGRISIRMASFFFLVLKRNKSGFQLLQKMDSFGGGRSLRSIGAAETVRGEEERSGKSRGGGTSGRSRTLRPGVGAADKPGVRVRTERQTAHEKFKTFTGRLQN